MSKWAQKKKRKYFIALAILLVVIAAVVAFKATDVTPTCFDGFQNGTETGVDCGGECARVCQEESKNLVVWWERPFRVAKGVYNTVAYIENLNLTAGLKEVSYEFRLYDKDNILVGIPRRGTTFIEPNKVSAVFESKIQTGESDAFNVFFKITSVQDWKRTGQDFSYSLFKVGEPSLTDIDSGPKLAATIENKSLLNFTSVPVVAIIYNQRGNAIAASQTIIDRLDQGSEEFVYYSWPEPFSDAVSRIEIIPRIDPFLSQERLTR